MIKVVSASVFEGPSLFAPVPAVRLVLGLQALAGRTPATLGSEFFQGIHEFLADTGDGTRVDGPLTPLTGSLGKKNGPGVTHVVAGLGLHFQRMADVDVTYWVARSGGADGTTEAVFAHWDPGVGLAAGNLAVQVASRLAEAAIPGGRELPGNWDPRAMCARFAAFVRGRSLDLSTAALVREAERRDIPWRRLNPRARYVQLGHGCLQKRVHETVTGATPFVSAWMGREKNVTTNLLMEMGLPVPRQGQAETPDQAVASAAEIGYPVVVKPADRGKGLGITVRITDAAGVRKAFAEAVQFSPSVLVEQFIDGDDHRILVVNGKVVAAARRIPGHVVGDGARTVSQLIAETNRDPRRGLEYQRLLVRLQLDDQAQRLLGEQDMGPDSIPEKGAVVYLRRTANISTGGTAVDVTETIHPDNCRMAVRAARILGLDIAGVDYLTTDIGRSHRESGGAICEVNVSPGLRPHWVADEGRDVVGPIIDGLFPPGASSRIPTAAVTGTNGKTTTTRMVARILEAAGHTVGFCSSDGIYVGGELIVKEDTAGFSGARLVLQDPNVDAAVMETARRGIILRGLYFDHCDVGAVLNIDDDHLDLDGIRTLDELARVKSLVVQVSRDMVVLNADDERCVRMADVSGARRLCYVTMKPDNPLIAEHLSVGGLAVTVGPESGGLTITLHDAGNAVDVIAARDIPATFGGIAVHNVQNAMFAVAIAHGLGKSVEHIRAALGTFACSFEETPGRLNIYDGLPFKVLVDYAHNPPGLDMINRLVERLEYSGRRILVFKDSGRHPDRQIRDLARTAAGHYDHYVCCREDDLKDRQPAEVPEMLRDTLLAEGVPAESISVIPVEDEAVKAALDMARPGDLLVILFAKHDRIWPMVTSYKPS